MTLLNAQVVPQIDFADIDNLTQEQIQLIKRRGSVVIRNIVPDDEVLQWKQNLREYIAANPSVDGKPSPFFMREYAHGLAILSLGFPEVKLFFRG